MSLTQSEQQLLSAFASTFSESDKNKREIAIVYIKQLEQIDDFLPYLFELMIKYSHHNPKIEIIQAIMNWIQKYLSKQYNPSYDAIKKISVIDLINFTISEIDNLLKSKNIPHKTILLLSKPLSMMLNHKYNSTIKLQYIESFTKLSKQNCGLLFFELYSILNTKQSQTIINRINPNLKNLIISLEAADQTEIPFYLQVIYMLFKQMSINHLVLKDIVNNKLFMDILLKTVQSGVREVSEYPILILTLLTEQKDNLNVKDTPLLSQINVTLFPVIYQYLIASANSIMSIEYRDNNEKFIIILLKYFTQFLKIAKDEELFHTKKEQILLGMIFPFLLIPKQQSQQMIKQSPQKYLKLKQDMAGDYEMENIGSLSANLLEIYCDKVDGITPLASQISFQIIQNHINIQKQVKNNFKNTTFFNISKSNERTEVALCVLCIVSYSVQERKQYISLLEEIIQKHIGVLFNPWETQVSLMFIILLEYYIDNLFMQESKQYLRAFILDAVLTTIAIHPQKALLLVLYDFIENMYVFGQYNMVIRTNTFKIGESLVSNIVIHEDVDAFHVFKKLLQCQACNVVSNYNSEFLQWLQKITINLKAFIENNQFNQFVIKGLDLLDSLMMNEQFQTLLDPIYNSISHYMLVFKNSEGPMFDQILTVVNRYIQMKKIIPQSVNILLQNIQPILEINDSNIYNIFRTLCLVIVHSTQQQQIQRIYQLGLLTLKETTSKTKSIMNPLQGILLLHLSIWHHIDKFSFDYLKSLVQQTLKVLSYQYIKHHRVMYGKYVLVILQCLRFRFEETTQIIKTVSQDTYQSFYKLIFEAAIYSDGYDRKVLIPSIVCMTYNKDFEPRFAYSAIRLLIDVLYNQYNAIKNQSIKPYQSDQSENDQQYRQQDLINQLTLSQNTKQIFILYPNPYAPNDQYAIFRQLVEHSKKFQHSSQIFSKVVADLPIGLQKFLTDYALRIQKVQGQTTIQARKIFKVKRNKQ